MREVVLRLLRGESLDALSRELGVDPYRLEEWRDINSLSGSPAPGEPGGKSFSTFDKASDPLERVPFRVVSSR